MAIPEPNTAVIPSPSITAYKILAQRAREHTKRVDLVGIWVSTGTKINFPEPYSTLSNALITCSRADWLLFMHMFDLTRPTTLVDVRRYPRLVTGHHTHSLIFESFPGPSASQDSALAARPTDLLSYLGATDKQLVTK